VHPERVGADALRAVARRIDPPARRIAASASSERRAAACDACRAARRFRTRKQFRRARRGGSRRPSRTSCRSRWERPAARLAPRERLDRHRRRRQLPRPDCPRSGQVHRGRQDPFRTSGPGYKCWFNRSQLDEWRGRISLTHQSTLPYRYQHGRGANAARQPRRPTPDAHMASRVRAPARFEAATLAREASAHEVTNAAISGRLGDRRTKRPEAWGAVQLRWGHEWAHEHGAGRAVVDRMSWPCRT